MTNKSIVISGQAAEGSGAIAGWRGAGPLRRADIIAAVAAAECPASWAPAPKSNKAHAGHAVRRLDNLGYVVRAARRPSKTPAGLPVEWDARWIVSQSHATDAVVGDAAGQVVLTVELTGDELRCEGGAALGAQVTEIFAELQAEEVMQAGDVTEWLARVLVRELGATRFGFGYYVPSGSRARANALCAAVAAQWGHAWICPLLPVATTDELKLGIARGFNEDIRAVANALRDAQEAARANGAKMLPGRAAQLLRSLDEIRERIVAYRAFCGEEAIRVGVAALNAIGEELASLCTKSDQRFAALELDAPASEPAPAPQPSPAERAAEQALMQRRVEREAAKGANIIEAASGVPTPAAFRVPPPPPLPDADLGAGVGMREIEFD